MHRLVRSIRFAGIVAAACLTLLSGLALVWFFVQPETLPLLSTWQLAAILGSFLLPGLCLGAWQADRQAAAHAPRPRHANAQSHVRSGQSAGRIAGQRSVHSADHSNEIAVVRVVKQAMPTSGTAIVPPSPILVAEHAEVQPAAVSTVGRLSPAGRSIHSDRSIHRHRRSARV
jgi:hypothetical protein